MRFLSIVLGFSLAASAHAQSKAPTKPDESDDDVAIEGNPPSTTGKAPADTLPGDSSPPAPASLDPQTPSTTPPGTVSSPDATHGPTSAETPPGTTRTIDSVGGAPLRLKSRRAKGDSVEPAHAEGAYMGVSLTGDGLPPKAPKLPMAKGLQRLTWPGFQVKDGVPTVFLQTTSTPDYSVAEKPGELVVTLHGTTIKLRNNERPLEVAEFGTDVREITAKPHGKDVIVTIRRKGSGHHERVEPSAGGFQMLLVELPQAAAPESGEGKSE